MRDAPSHASDHQCPIYGNNPSRTPGVTQRTRNARWTDDRMGGGGLTTFTKLSVT